MIKKTTVLLVLLTAGVASAEHNWREELSRQYHREREMIRKECNRHEDDLRDRYEAQRDRIRRTRDRASRHLSGRERSAVRRHYQHLEDQLNDDYRAQRKALDRRRNQQLDAAKHRYEDARRHYELGTRYDRFDTRLRVPLVSPPAVIRPPGTIQRYRTVPHACPPPVRVYRQIRGGSIHLPIAGGISIRF